MPAEILVGWGNPKKLLLYHLRMLLCMYYLVHIQEDLLKNKNQQKYAKLIQLVTRAWNNNVQVCMALV